VLKVPSKNAVKAQRVPEMVGHPNWRSLRDLHDSAEVFSHCAFIEAKRVLQMRVFQ
jgi:hypothetical protein